MFTLYDLVNSTTIQGNIRLSIWKNYAEEIECVEILNTDDLEREVEMIDRFVYLEIMYIFCTRDGFMQIELNKNVVE